MFEIRVTATDPNRWLSLKYIERKIDVRYDDMQGSQENALCARRQDAMVKAVCPMEHASTVVSRVTREDSAESISEQS